MSQKIKSVFLAGLPAIVIAAFLAVAIIYAWTEPSSAPPAGNVSAPLNVSTTTQYKGGALGIGGLLRGYSDAIFDGNVGIGTTSPEAKLEVAGQIKVTGGSPGAGKVLTSDANGLSSWQTVASSADGCGSLNSPANSCYLSIDVDGDGKTPLTGDCDETCNTCFTGSTAGTDEPDGKDQDCDRQIDESSFVSCNEYYYSTGCICSGGTSWDATRCSTADCWTAVSCSSMCVFANSGVMISWYCNNTGSCCSPVYRYF